MGVPFFTIDQATAIFVQDSKLLLSETALRKLDLRSKNEAAAVDPMGKSIYIYVCVCLLHIYIYIYIYGTPQDLNSIKCNGIYSVFLNILDSTT